MEKLLKKKFVRTLLIVYVLSYLLHDFFFANTANAEAPIQNTNLVAIIVDKNIYDDSTVKNKIERYATDYIQQKITDSKAIVLPINIDNFKAHDIVKMLENMYFDGIKDAPSKLIGLVLIGNIPLPVVENNTFVYPSIYPYVDFEDQQFVYSADKEYFSYNNVPNPQAEIRHGIINFPVLEGGKDDIAKYEKFFNKLQSYNSNPSTFIAPKIRYDDFVATKEYFLTDNVTYYVNSFLFTEDVGYRRFTNMLLDTLKGEHTKVVTNAATDLTNGLSNLIPSNPDPDEEAADDFGKTIKTLMDKFNQVMGDIGSSNPGSTPPPPGQTQEEPPSPDSPTLMLKSMIQEFLKTYDTLLGTKYLTRIRDNVKTPARWYQEDSEGNKNLSFDSHYNKIVLNDTWAAGNLESGIPPVLVDFNGKMEEALNQKIDTEKYYMYIPVLTKYFDRTNDEKKKRAMYENFYFGKKAEDIESAQDFSTYRGTYGNLQNVGSLVGVTFNAPNKTIGGSYKVFSQQIEANRGYNLRNTEADLEKFTPREGKKRFSARNYDGQALVNAWKLKKNVWKEKNKKERYNILTQQNEEGTSEGGQDVINKNRGGATPLNLDANQKLKYYSYKDARQPIFDIAGSDTIPSAQPTANSYLGSTTFTSVFKTKIDNGERAYIYPRATKEEDEDGDDSGTVDQATLETTTEGGQIAFVHKQYGSYYDFFSIYPNFGDSESDYEYFYKTIDSRVYNISPTPEQINGTITSSYGIGSEPHKLYTKIIEEVKGANDGLAARENTCDSGVQEIQDTLSQIDILAITGFDVAGYTGSITGLANTRNATITNTGEALISGAIQKAHNSLQEIDDFLLSSKTVILLYSPLGINFISTGTEYSTSLSVLGALDLIEEYQANNGIKIGFFTLLTGAVSMLSGQIDDINAKITTLESTFAGLNSRKTTAENNLNALVANLDGQINALSGKKDSINQLQIVGTGIATGCANNYKPLCDAIDITTNKLTASKAGLQSTLGNRAKTYTTEIYWKRAFTLPDQDPIVQQPGTTTGLESDTLFNRINTGIAYHNTAQGITTEIQNLKNMVNGFTRIDTLSPTDVKKAGGMDMTTRQRPIDNIRNVTFQGIGGGLVQFNYPNLYEVETFKSDGTKLILKKSDEIAQSIKSYLTGKVKEYNDLLTAQQNNSSSFYAANPGAFNELVSNNKSHLLAGNTLANPASLRPYSLIPEDFFINQLGSALNMPSQDAINIIAKLMYYQNITRQEKQPQTNILNDINETKASFDINKKTSYIMNNYLKKDNDQGPLLTPTYSTGGYEVAFINSDSQDYIKAKPTPTEITEILNIQESQSNRLTQAPEEDPAAKSLAEACKFDPSGSELIFDTKTLSSPWLKAMKCRFTETMKNPFKVTVDYSNAMGPTLQNFVGEVNQSMENRQGSFGQYASQRGALDTQESNDTTIANATTAQQATLKDILAYTEIRLSSTGQDQATSWQLGDQTIGKQLRIFATRDVGNLDINVQVTGANCFGISLTKNVDSDNDNVCQKAKLIFNPFSASKEYNIIPLQNKAGTTVITVEFCLKNTNTCIKKASKIEILADPIAKASIKVASNEVIAGGEVPFSVQGEDQYGNKLGLVAPEVTLSTLTGEGQIRNGGTTSSELTFSDFNKTTLSYVAPSQVPNDIEMQTTIYFSGLSKVGGERISVTTGYKMTVIKGFLDIYFEGSKVFEHNNMNSIQPIIVSLNGAEDITNASGKINKTLVPKIILSLKDKSGVPLTRVQSMALISTQNKLLIPGEVKNNKFINNGNFIISGGLLEIYLNPSLKVGNDTLYISIPGIDTVKIPVTITPGKAEKVSVAFDKETATPGETIQAKIKVTDLRDNPIDQSINVKLQTKGALTMLDDSKLQILASTGESIVELKTIEPGGESFLTAQLESLALDQQTPGYKDILVQNTLLPETGLNIMYLNLFGTDRGNQRGYFSDKKEYVNRLMDQSEKLLAVTTQLMDPAKLKSTDVIITENAQIKNLAGKEISLQIVNKNFIVKIAEIGEINIGVTNDFGLEKYVPEALDSIIQKNEISGKKIMVNDQEIMNLSNGNIADGILITLAADKADSFSKRDILMGEKKVGQLILERKDTWILDNADDNINITNPEYDQKEIFAEGSTNGRKGIGLYQINSAFSKEGYKSIEDNSNSTLGLGFTNNFKNITYFGNGKSVGESTQPFGSQFLINFGDPLLKKVSSNIKIKANQNITTDFDGSLGEPVYSDPTRPIFKVLPIDFNQDGLQDLLIVYRDGTLKIMKNYGGNTPYSNLQDLAVIADSIKDVIIGDVDGNEYPDIMIRTNSNKLKAYTNQKGVFDVDGNLVCLNTYIKIGKVSQTPDDIGKVSQIFFEDMDDDDKLDIVTNDNRGDIKIFYGGSNADGANYLSNLDYTCDGGRYERQKDHMQVVRTLGMKIDENLIVQDQSLIHRKGLTGSTAVETIEDEDSPDTNPFTSTLDGWKHDGNGNIIEPRKVDKQELKDLKAESDPLISDATGKAENFVNDLDTYAAQGLEAFTKYISSPIDQLPAYEPESIAKELILYAQSSSLSGNDAASVYKKFEDINGDILEPGDEVLVTTTIGAIQKSTFTYLENIQVLANSEIETDDNNQITSFRFATGSITGDINRDIGDPYEFMIDNIKLNVGESIRFSYIFRYLGTPGMKIDVKDEEVMTPDLPYAYTQGVQNGKVTTQGLTSTKAKDKLPDIILYPNNSCKKYKLTLFNTQQNDNKKYEDIFFNIQQKIDDENAKLKAQAEANIKETNNATQVTSLDGIQDMPGMDTVFESRDPQGVFAASSQGGGTSVGLNMNSVDQSTAKVQKKMDTALNGACQGFSVGKNKTCQGLPVPFNQAFLAPGNYHIFGCQKIQALDNTIGKGLPAIAFPTSSIIPIRPPTPTGAGGILGGEGSMVRVYVVPTLTLGVGIAICLGPYSLGKVIPKPFREVAGNCVVFAIPPITNCKDTSNNGGESDQIVDQSTFEAAQNGTCANPPKPQHNVITFAPDTTSTSTQLSSPSPLVTLWGKEVAPAGEGATYPQPDTREGNFFGLAMDQKPVKVNTTPGPSQSTSARSPNATFDFGGGEKFVLSAGEKIDLKVLSSISKGLIKCIVKDWADKQVMFMLTNMTKLTVSVSFPDLAQLGEGWDKISFDKFKKILKDENAKDIANGTTKPLSLKDKGLLTGAKELFSKQVYQNRSNQASNPFDAIMVMFKEVPLININTKDINIKIPMVGSEDITKYIAYMNTWYETNKKILERWLEMTNNVLSFCSRISKDEAPQEIADRNKELDFIMASTTISNADKNTYSGNIHKELRDLSDILALTGDTTWQKFGNDFDYLGNNLQLAYEKMKQRPRLEWQELRLSKKSPRTAVEDDLLQIVSRRLEKVNKCGDFVANLGGFITFYDNSAGLVQSIRQNIKVMEQYKTFPLQLYERLHVTDRYLTEITSIFADFTASIMYWMKTNADRFSKYVDAIILMIGVMKTRQVLIDFSVNRSKKCGKCTNDDYSPQSCSLGFLCPKIPVLKIPNFRIPNLYIDLSHLSLGIDITLPNFNFKPVTIPMIKIPNLPEPPKFEIFLEYDYGLDLDMMLGYSKNLNLPTIPILPGPPQLPELPSFIPNINVTLPIIPPAPRVPKISSKIELTLKIAEFISKLYCIIKGGIGLVGEKGVKGKVEQITQRTWNVPIFDYFDTTAKLKEKPLKGFDYQLDAYLNLKYNFDGFYSFLNNVVQPINNLSNMVEGVTQETIDTTQTQINNNDVIDKFNDIENFQIPSLNSYIPDEQEETLEYADAYTDVKKGLALFKNKADEKNDTQTTQTLKTLESETQTKSNIAPAYQELENASTKANELIKNKQHETQKLAQQIQNDYEGFIKSIQDTPNILVKDDSFATTISTPLFKADNKTLAYLQKQENPNETYIKLNKSVIDGYVKALDTQSASTLNMSETSYARSKGYLQDLNKKIEQATPLIAANFVSLGEREKSAGQRDLGSKTISNNNPSTTNPAPKLLIAQNPPPPPNIQIPCTSCGGGGASADLSQFVRGVFVQVYSGSEKLMVNTVKSEENVLQIGKNYLQFDINNDGNSNNNNPNDDLKDIIMRDENNIYIKYANLQNEYEDTNFNTKYYVHELDSPDDFWDDDKVEVKDDGYVDISDITLKLADESWEVKNFKMQGQNFESIAFGWMNSALMGDKPDGYLIKLNQRVDTFNDRDESDGYGLDEEEFNKKYVLVLPEGTSTGGLISLKEGFSDKRPIQSLITGNSSDAGTIIEVKFYDPTQEKINITLTEIPRTRQYGQVAVLKKHQEKLSQTQAEKFGLYEIASTRSNQIVAGRQLIGDTVGPEGEFTLYRPQIDEVVGTGDTLGGFVSTHYTLRANREDNVAVQAMWIEKDGEIITFESGFAQTGFIDLPGLFYTGETKENWFFGAQDFNGNVSRTQINLEIKIPELEVIGTNKINDESTEIIAELSNDLDEGNVLFQRERNSIRSIMTGTNGTYFPLTGRQTIITGGIFSVGNTIGFYNIDGDEVGTLNPKNGRIIINSGFVSTIKVQLDLTSHMPLIKIVDAAANSTLFQINLPTESLVDIAMQQGAPAYEKTALEGTTFGIFNNGYCIKDQSDACIIFVGPEGQIYIPTPYHNALEGIYEFDTTNSNILYHIKDQNNNAITTISVKFKPQQ